MTYLVCYNVREIGALGVTVSLTDTFEAESVRDAMQAFRTKYGDKFDVVSPQFCQRRTGNGGWIDAHVTYENDLLAACKTVAACDLPDIEADTELYHAVLGVRAAIAEREATGPHTAT